MTTLQIENEQIVGDMMTERKARTTENEQRVAKQAHCNINDIVSGGTRTARRLTRVRCQSENGSIACRLLQCPLPKSEIVPPELDDKQTMNDERRGAPAGTS